jgi:mercuric ion binding protein
MKQSSVLKAIAIATGTMAVGSAASIHFPVPSSFATEIAVTQTATFAIENMTCALCPITVKSAMEKVIGVNSVQIDFEAKTATVVFDPAVTTLEAIAASSTNAGYPATVQG